MCHPTAALEFQALRRALGERVGPCRPFARIGLGAVVQETHRKRAGWSRPDLRVDGVI
ncbi:MAG TPA: hypothetical protein VHZ73_00595 [Vicinamibacterales bacterium]|nr:hypothetical protein [Vicinamibacterales bacterium]